MNQCELEIFEEIDFADGPISEEELLSTLPHLRPSDVFEALRLLWSLDIIERDRRAEDGGRIYYIPESAEISEAETYIQAVGAAHDR